jgi:uncharacterized protein YbjT (DUF2867 family)
LRFSFPWISFPVFHSNNPRGAHAMAKNIYSIMGATGNIGEVLTDKLIKNGHEVRALGRNKDKLTVLQSKGAKICPVKFDNEASLAEAFQGATAVFSFIPPSFDADDFGAQQDRVGEAIVAALTKAKIKYVLNLSSVGAHLKKGTGPIQGLQRHEERLNSLKGVNILHLRPVYFMENQFLSIPLIKSEGINGSPLRSDLPIPVVATRDIGAKASIFLDRLDFKGINEFEFVGPDEVTLEKFTSVLGKSIGKAGLRYVQFPYEEAKKAMLSSGMKPSIVDLLMEMDRSYNEGKILPTQEINKDHQGSTTIEQFAQVFAAAYRESS